MSRRTPEWLRDQVAIDSGHRCGYCLTPQELVNIKLEAEHLMPQARGGETVRENLWLSCRTCNGFKSDHIRGIDPLTERRAALFNPRTQRWSRHFRWHDTVVVGTTAIGRATVETLRLNHRTHLAPREFWRRVGLFPFSPASDSH